MESMLGHLTEVRTPYDPFDTSVTYKHNNTLTTTLWKQQPIEPTIRYPKLISIKTSSDE